MIWIISQKKSGFARKPDFYKAELLLAGKYIADNKAQRDHDHDNNKRDDQLRGIAALFQFRVLRTREARDEAFGKTLNDGKGEHGGGDQPAAADPVPGAFPRG